MNLWAITIGSLLYLGVFLAVLIPQFRRLQRRREEIGDRELPVPYLAAGLAIVAVGSAAGLSMITWGSSGVATAGWAVAGLSFAGGIELIILGALRAQRT
jgi:hypothetical protein